MENVVANLLQHLATDRYESQVWCLESADVLGEELRLRGGTVREFGKKRRRDPGLFLRLGRELSREGVDLLHCHDELSWFYGSIAALGVPHTRVVMTTHGRRARISRRHLAEQRLLASRTSIIVAVSEYLRTQLLSELRLRPSHVVTVKNGIPVGEAASELDRREARNALGVESDVPLVGTVGELSAVKNLSLAIEAVAKARHACPALQFVIIGTGTERHHLERRAVELGAGTAVRFAGLRRDVARLLPALDAYLCSSDYEGVSLSILEAMAAAQPVVATAVGGNPELVTAGVTGELVAPRDATGMARAIVKVLESPDRRREYGSAARRRVLETFSVERMAEDYDRLYSRVLARHAETATAAGATRTAGT
jgi:glycosyltransferase involved in cell wall biosynthesis